MTIKNTIIRRLPTILLTSQIFSLIIITPVFLNTELKLSNYLLILVINITFGITSWMLNIIFSAQPFKSMFWKWLASSVCLILLLSSIHPITKNLFTINIKNVWGFRALGLTFMNSIVFFINTLIDVLETKKRLETLNNQLNINRLESQLANLKNHINPHFLFNALSSLKSLIRRNPEMAETYLIKLSEFLRISITQADDLLSLQDELFLCEAFIDLQKVRFQNGLIYETDIDPNSLNERIPPFALQSLVENSLKHNIVSSTNPLKIRVEVKGRLLTIINNVQALLSSEASSKTGLLNLDERMKILTGQPIVIDQNQAYFKVQLTLLSAL